MLDFLRIDDIRYFGLTPGQYSAVLLTVVGYLVMRKARRAAVATPSQG